jgi:hypothetical protein
VTDTPMIPATAAAGAAWRLALAKGFQSMADGLRDSGRAGSRTARPPDPESHESGKRTDDIDAYSIEEFCRRHSISRSTYYVMQKEGTGPVEGRVKNRVLISKESSWAWRQKITEPTSLDDKVTPARRRKQNRRP